MITIDIGCKSKKWQKQQKLVEEICKKILPLTSLNKLLQKNITIEVAISLLSDLQMQKINLQFRGKDKATNVLSFPANEAVSAKSKYVFLGDILIAFETVKKESLAQNKSFENHLTHMILHSILHLIGFDHEDEESAKIMETLEIKILKKLKIANPYIN